jgi:hypothetical protein
MSFHVLVIPEDFRQDQYVLKPIITRMMKAIGIPARVEVCRDPLLGGVEQALEWVNLEQIFERYQGMVRLFVLVVDRDADANRRQRIRRLEQLAAERFAGTDRMFVGENAWQELEVWLLAGMQDLPSEWSWKAIRAERDAKEAYFDPYVDRRGLRTAPYQGRAFLAEEASRRYDRIRQLCPEDVGALHEALSARLSP